MSSLIRVSILKKIVGVGPLGHVLRRWISRQLSLEGSMRRWFGQYCYKKALTSCKNVPWLKLSWSEPTTGSSFSATHDWSWYWAYYQAANRALRSTGGTLAPERSLPRIAARSGTNCDVTNLSRSSRSPGPVHSGSASQFRANVFVELFLLVKTYSRRLN